MSGSPMPFARRSLGPLSQNAPHCRRHERLAATRRGWIERFCMRADNLEYPSRLIDASADGAAIRSPVGVDSGDCELAVPGRKVRAVSSMAGASTNTPARPQIATEVRLGKRRTRVMPDPVQGFGAPCIHFPNAVAACRYFC